MNNRRHPDPVLLRALSRYQRQLLGRVIRLDPGAAVTTLDTDLPLDDFAAGVALTNVKTPIGAEVSVGGAQARRLDLVPWRDHGHYRGGVYLYHNTLFLTGQASDWTGYDLLRFYYVPEPAVLALSLASTLDALPDAAEACLVDYLASIMAERGGTDEGVQPPDRVWYRAQWQSSEAQFLDEIAKGVQAVVSTIRDVM